VAPAGAPGAAVPRSDAERELLRDVEAEYARYVAQANLHHKRVRQLLIRERDRRVAELDKRFAERIARAGSDRTRWRSTSKELLLKFLAEHPDHPQFSPDAHFRLADIYLDEADAAVEDKPDELADYAPALAEWETILAKFPAYRQIPSVLYLLGHYLKGDDPRRSLQLFRSLTCGSRYKWTDPAPEPPTRAEVLALTNANLPYTDPYAGCEAIPGADPDLVRHAWVRGVADHHFDVPGELDGAVSGYLQVADKVPDSPLFAEALYKLAWSYYKRDDLLDAARRFDASLVAYDKTVAAGRQPQLELRDEALLYIAIAFTDPWDGETSTDPDKAFERAETFYAGREAEPHVRDVWVAMGNAFLALTAYDQAVGAFRKAIGPPWELDPTNPTVHQKIVDAYMLAGDKDAADRASAELATRYAPGTPWYQANERDLRAMETQRQIAEFALYAAAQNTFAAAMEDYAAWDAGGRADAELRTANLAEFQDAVRLTTLFIEQYPTSPHIYAFYFNLAESLFYSDDFLGSIPFYEWVRDHRQISEEFYFDAAKGVLYAVDQEVERQVAAGALPPLRVPTADELKALPQPITPLPIPEMYQRQRDEWARYQELVPDPQSAPQQGINAALMSLVFLDLDDAVARLERVLDKFCKTPAAATAKDALLSIYLARSDLDRFQATNDAFIDGKCGDDASIVIAQGQNRKVDFGRAGSLLGDKRYLEAGEAFYTYYRTAPPDDPDRPTALYNAAVAYLLGERPKTAVGLFKEFTQSRDKAFRESPYFIKAMELTARSYQSAMDFGAAVGSYLELYTLAKNAQGRGITLPEPLPGETPRTLAEISLDALYNAALFAELDRNFTAAIKHYTQYLAEETDRRKLDRAQWSIARMYRVSGDLPKLVAAYDKWRKAYGRDAGNENDYVYSFHDIAKAYQAKGKTADADKWAKQTIAAFAEVGKPGSQAAIQAGEFALMFAERAFDATYVPLVITKQPKDDKELLKAKQTLVAARDAAVKLYQDLGRYSVPEYAMAREVRTGEAKMLYTEKLRALPPPKKLVELNDLNPDANLLAIYEETLQNELTPIADAARKHWENVVQVAKEDGVFNRWSQLALELLARDYPDEYTVLHQDLVESTTRP
jgi:outer membrane protein assembly factor BamD (BamD/ComL family)